MYMQHQTGTVRMYISRLLTRRRWVTIFSILDVGMLAKNPHPHASFYDLTTTDIISKREERLGEGEGRWQLSLCYELGGGGGGPKFKFV